MPNEFKKNDDGKLQWSSFCWKAAAKVMQVMHHGADKYGWENWRKAQTDKDRKRYLDATFRHMIAYAGGERFDPDSGKPTLWHAACSLLFYLEYDKGVPKRMLPPGSCETDNISSVDATIHYGTDASDLSKTVPPLPPGKIYAVCHECLTIGKVMCTHVPKL